MALRDRKVLLARCRLLLELEWKEGSEREGLGMQDSKPRLSLDAYIHIIYIRHRASGTLWRVVFHRRSVTLDFLCNIPPDLLRRSLL